MTDLERSDGVTVVIVAHGSHRNPNSSAVVRRHAERIRVRAVFDEVLVGFWKGDPSLREVLRTTSSERVVVVPLLTSDGYFANTVFPRELRVTNEEPLDVTADVQYTEPVGTHSAVADAIADRATAIIDGAVAPEDVGLAVVGHGTERHEKSARVTREHVTAIRGTGRFGAVRAFFLDEAPHVDDVEASFETDDVVVVANVVGGGAHARRDLPVRLGLIETPDDGYPVPAMVGDRRIWYAGTVGDTPVIADVIVARARDAIGVDALWDTASDATHGKPVGDAFGEWLEASTTRRVWGELAITSDATGFSVRHHEDTGRPSSALEIHRNPRGLITTDATGQYRPHRGARSLQTGWVIPGLDAAGVRRIVDEFYPASVENWYRGRIGRLDVTPFRETAARQTGRYADLSGVSDRDLACTVKAVCGACVKRRAWDGTAESAITAERKRGHPVCREACSFFLEAASTFQHTDERDRPQATQQPPTGDPSVPPSALENPQNRYRQRYREAKRDRTAALIP